MTDAMTLENPTTARLVALSAQFPELQAQQITDDTIRLSVADSDSPIFVDYFRVDNVQNNDDAWRYFLSHQTDKTEHAGQFSHPTERGCWIMAKKYFAENGYIKTPRDNTHLTPKTAKIAQQAQAMRDRRAQCVLNGPETGDLIVDLEGITRRVCLAHADRCQQTTALEHRYYVGTSGTADYSGSLYGTITFDRLTQIEDPKPALFWTFKDGQSGAGRGVDLWLNVTVWTFDGLFGSNAWEVN